MSRFQGWLVRFIVMHGTPAALTIKVAAKHACIRPMKFAEALHDSKLVRLDAISLGIDPDEFRAVHDWMRQMQADEDVRDSMVASAAAVVRIPSSERYRGSSTRLGVTCPNPGGSRHRDNLNLPVDPIEHPEPQGEWHVGLNAAGRRIR